MAAKKGQEVGKNRAESGQPWTVSNQNSETPDVAFAESALGNAWCHLRRAQLERRGFEEDLTKPVRRVLQLGFF
jgi:hypothetical protein